MAGNFAVSLTIGLLGKESLPISQQCQSGEVVRLTFWCAEMLNWVLKLFSFHDIMSKVRIANSGGRFFPPPFFCQMAVIGDLGAYGRVDQAIDTGFDSRMYSSVREVGLAAGLSEQ
jgi:hypothetical protein